MAVIPTIPGYTIDRELGQGGMARVYLAHEHKLDRTVALKVLLPSYAELPNAVERFTREARTSAKLVHSNIITIHDVGSCGDAHYIAMEYLEGGSIKERIQRGPVDPAQAFLIVRQVASALQYAHEQGYIHRDIKSDNIMFRRDGTAVLTDFGIARAVSSATKLTKPGMSVGTPHYMSPEQGRGKTLDGRSDIYSLGVVLYEMLTGHVPFEAEDDIAIVVKHIQEPPPRLPAQLSRYQGLLDAFLEKDPEKRLASGRDVCVSLEPLLSATGPGNRQASANEAGARPGPINVQQPPYVHSEPILSPVELTLNVPFMDTAGESQYRVEYEQEIACDVCGGAAVEGAFCSACGGSGRKRVRRDLLVTVPEGTEDGTVLRIPAIPANRSPEILVKVKVQPDRFLRREGSDIYTQLLLRDSDRGQVMSVPTIRGTKSIRIQNDVRHGTKIRLSGLGFKKPDGSVGDAYFEVAFPFSSERPSTSADVGQTRQPAVKQMNETGTVKCPLCGLFSPDGAMRCDCGYDFVAGHGKKSSMNSGPTGGVKRDRIADSNASESFQDPYPWIPVVMWSLFVFVLFSILGGSAWLGPGGSFLSLICIVASLVFVSIDASKLRLDVLDKSSLKLSATDRYTPRAWAIAFFFLWLVFFPIYMVKRKKLALAAYRTLTENLYMSAEEVARRRRRTNRDAIVFALILVGLVIGIIVLVAYLAK